MANTKLLFYGTRESETDQHELECFVANDNEICISLTGDILQFISLDISTAIKLAKTLRTEINKAKEVSNG